MNLKYYADRKSVDSARVKLTWQRKLLFSFLKKGFSVLDVGCADGNLHGVVKKKNAKYSGVDYNDYFINICEKKGLSVKKCDVSKESIPFSDNSFDIIWCSHVLEHMGTYQQIHLFKEFNRVLKKGGRLFLFAPSPYHWYFWDDETHVRPCTHGQLINLAKNFNLEPLEAKYSLTRFFSNSLQKWLRLPPFRFFLWTVYLVAEKK